jgi:hypothetical protein
MNEYELQKGPLPGSIKAGEWLRNVETAYSSDGPAVASPVNGAPNGLNPTLPAAPHNDQYVLDSELEDGRRRRRSPQAMMLFEDGQLHAHKDYDGVSGLTAKGIGTILTLFLRPYFLNHMRCYSH